MFGNAEYSKFSDWVDAVDKEPELLLWPSVWMGHMETKWSKESWLQTSRNKSNRSTPLPKIIPRSKRGYCSSFGHGAIDSVTQ